MRDISKDITMRAAKGDMCAFEEIYRRASGYVYTVAYRVTGNREDAEEVTQDVFLKAHRYLKGFRFKAAFKTWLYRITVNTAINTAKKRAKITRPTVEYNDAVNMGNTPGKEAPAIDKEHTEWLINDLLKVLTPDQRICVTLRNIEGLKYREIADTLKIKVNTVRTRLKRARERLLAYRRERGDRS